MELEFNVKHFLKAFVFTPQRPQGAITPYLKFRMCVKYGLKAQKLLAQGIALCIMAISNAPCKGNSFIYCLEF